MEPARRDLLERIADLLRGNYPGCTPDALDGGNWIMTALDGDADALAALDDTLTALESGT